jgi:isopentenyl-diphosphate delta-isomerase
MGLGSIRAALEHEELAGTFQVRDAAPSIPLLANLGAVQLNYGFTADHCLRALELVEADGLVLHLNSLQEVFQPEGNTNFQHLLGKIEQLCRRLPVPVGVKEVGWGIAGDVASQLHAAGVRFIDVAGAGGTSWSQVEKFRTPDKVRQEAAKAFADWGIPTAECVREVRQAVPQATVIASGGIDDGVQAAKAIALGADLVGIGRTLLFAAAESREMLEHVSARYELELKTAMFAIGAGSLAELRGTERLVPKS